jgi:hypothetical protein
MIGQASYTQKALQQRQTELAKVRQQRQAVEAELATLKQRGAVRTERGQSMYQKQGAPAPLPPPPPPAPKKFPLIPMLIAGGALLLVGGVILKARKKRR